MNKTRVTQTKKRHLKIYNLFLQYRKDYVEKNGTDGIKKVSNSYFYDMVADEEGWDSEFVRKVCNKLSKEGV